jgi:hypothetical protein
VCGESPTEHEDEPNVLCGKCFATLKTAEAELARLQQAHADRLIVLDAVVDERDALRAENAALKRDR